MMEKILGSALLLGLIVVFKVSLIAAAMLWRHYCGSRTEAVRERIAARPGRVLALGIVDMLAAVVVFLFLVSVAEHIPVAGLFVLAWLALVGLAILDGLAAVYAAIGERIDPTAGQAGQTIRGGAALEAAVMLPLLGWIAHLGILCLALGAGTMQLFARAPRSALPGGVGAETAQAGELDATEELREESEER